MYLVEVFFNYDANQAQQQNLQQQGAVNLINQILEQWRYNGQIIGREFPIFYDEIENKRGFTVKVISPAQHSLMPYHNNENVNHALIKAAESGIFLEQIGLVAEDLNSNISHQNELPSWQILYTTYLHTCSPLFSGDHFLPLPLYLELQQHSALSMDLIKWQENWQACDQLQMNGAVLEQQALQQISMTDSPLFKHGYHLCKEISEASQIPTYYYLYHLGSRDHQQEKQRKCPLCKQDWLLEKPLFNLFHFKCDHCRLVSNLSWYDNTGSQA
ncbi:Zn-ribbon-containing protein [Pasteurella testudinis]|uniref:Zn-ribbon-containing protein n=1 Tax=Pasteurella testudinis TaxID=761 RepID=UPI004058D222